MNKIAPGGLLKLKKKSKAIKKNKEQKRQGNTIKPCDDQGKLCMTAVAANENGKELVEVIREGFDCEMLSWKMGDEELSAAAVISCALNKCADLAIRLTGVTSASRWMRSFAKVFAKYL